MNDDFLHRMRKEPPAAFVIALKAKLDKQAEASQRVRRTSRSRYALWLSLFGTAAFASSLVVTYMYRKPSVSSVVPAVLSPRPPIERTESSVVTAPPVNTRLIDSSASTAEGDFKGLIAAPAAHPSASVLRPRLAKRRETVGAALKAAPPNDTTVGVLAAPSGEPPSSTERSPPGPSPASDAETFIAPTAPLAQDLEGDSLHDFVLHHATTHFSDTSDLGNLARWRGGKQSICPASAGLSAGFNAFVTARIRAIATYVGAPVDPDKHCKTNVQIEFSNRPQEKMESILNWATGPAFRNRYSGGRKTLLAFTEDHAVQGWYVITSGGAVVLNRDVSNDSLDVQPVWPRITQNYLASNVVGSRLGRGSGTGAGIGIVILVVDQSRVSDMTVGSISDYLAMLTLSEVQDPDHCDPLPSILDLMSTKCGARGKATAMTPGDFAFLKALYYKNTGLGPSLTRAEILGNMVQQFKHQ